MVKKDKINKEVVSQVYMEVIWEDLLFKICLHQDSKVLYQLFLNLRLKNLVIYQEYLVLVVIRVLNMVKEAQFKPVEYLELLLKAINLQVLLHREQK